MTVSKPGVCADALLRAEELTISRGDREIVRERSLVVHAGERVLLRGANGVGKTSLLETLAGLREPVSGRIERRGEMVWVGHRNALNAAFSAQENLEFWCVLNGLPTSGVVAALKRLGLVGRARSRPSRGLSTGQKRRAALARLALSAAPLWLVDEPLAGLDMAALPLFADLLGEHQVRGGAVLLTTHQALPDRVAPDRIIDL